MLNFKNITTIVLLLALFAATPIPAAESGSLNYTVLEELSIQGKGIPKGRYEVKWEVEGRDAQVSFIPAGESVGFMLKGKVEKTINEYEFNSFVYKNNPNGKRTISQFEIGGKKFRIIF